MQRTVEKLKIEFYKKNVLKSQKNCLEPDLHKLKVNL